MNPARRCLVSGGVFALLAVIGLVMSSAYIVEIAGPVIDVAGKYQGKQLVTLSGAKTYTSSAKPFMTMVSSYRTAGNRAPSVQVFTSLFAPNMQAVPVWAPYSENKTPNDVDKKNAALTTDFQDDAAVVALGETDHTIAMKLVVADVPKSSRTSGKLAKGDVLTSISAAGQKTKIRTYSNLVQRLAKIAPGTTAMVGFAHGGKEKTAEIVTVVHEADVTSWTHSGSKLGVYLSGRNSKYPVKVNYGVEQIGGPSAGLMFSLAIYDDLTPGSLGGDKVIASTGTMSIGGDVGPIGSIQRKFVGASQKGVKHFLAPVENCAETVGHGPKGMKVYSVRTFGEAVKTAQVTGAGKTSDLQMCCDVIAKSPRK